MGTRPSSAIKFNCVSKSFAIYHTPSDRLRELVRIGSSKHPVFRALADISIDIPWGSTYCVIGENGSGKSTLLQIMAGVMQPSSGSVEVNGRVAALLELGSGFNPEFSGRENVYLSASVLGFNRKQISAKFEEIIAFAEIGDFLDEPVKTYSTGMAIRLAFAVAIHVDPDILLIDEALAVGDIYFRQRCLRKIQELRSNGVTVVFVSHAMADVSAIGEQCIWLQGGRVCLAGVPSQVVPAYLDAMASRASDFATEKNVLAVVDNLSRTVFRRNSIRRSASA